MDFSCFERYRPLVDDWQAFTAALERPLPTCVWANTLRLDGPSLERWMAATGLDARPLPWLPGAFRLPEDEDGPGARFEYVAGLYHVQEEVSLLPPVLLEPRPGERVLDLCAAPGGKTAQIAVAMANRGTVVANDRAFERLTTLRSTLDRLGVLNVCTVSCDGTSLPRRVGLFDRVLADVPCSCEGTSRKSPEVLDRVSADYSLSLAGLQEALLGRAVELLRPGGRIVYSTCTYAPEENEMVVAAVLERFAGVLELVPATVPGLVTRPGITSWAGRRLPTALEGALRVWPHDNDTGGFFVAVLEKTATLGSEPPEVPPVAEQPGLEVAPDPWRDYFQWRFELEPGAFEGLHVLRRNQRLLGAVTPDHRPPSAPEPLSIGMPWVYRGMRYPKPTSAAARILAPAARRNRLDLAAGPADDVLRRRPFDLETLAAGEARGQGSLDGPGYVLLCHPGGEGEGSYGLGMAMARRIADGEGGGLRLESLSPKRWAEAAPGRRLPGLRECLYGS